MEWARAHGIDARSLNLWRLHLELRDQGAGRPGRVGRTRPRPPRTSRRAGLVELVPAASRAVAVAAAVAGAEGGGATYTVEVAGARISFGDDFSAAALRRVLEVLRSC